MWGGRHDMEKSRWQIIKGFCVSPANREQRMDCAMLTVLVEMYTRAYWSGRGHRLFPNRACGI